MAGSLRPDNDIIKKFGSTLEMTSYSVVSHNISGDGGNPANLFDSTIDNYTSVLSDQYIIINFNEPCNIWRTCPQNSSKRENLDSFIITNVDTGSTIEQLKVTGKVPNSWELMCQIPEAGKYKFYIPTGCNRTDGEWFLQKQFSVPVPDVESPGALVSIESLLMTTSYIKEYADQKDLTYQLEQDSTDGHKITFKPSVGEPTTIIIPDNDTTYEKATSDKDGLMAKEDKEKIDSLEFEVSFNKTTNTITFS